LLAALPTALIGLAPLLALAPFELCDFALGRLLTLFDFAAFFAAFGFDCDFALFGAVRFFDFVLV